MSFGLTNSNLGFNPSIEGFRFFFYCIKRFFKILLLPLLLNILCTLFWSAAYEEDEEDEDDDESGFRGTTRGDRPRSGPYFARRSDLTADG